MKSILVIDDNVPFASIMAEALTRAGYRVCQANGGKEGIRLLQLHSIDLVITDIVMPEQDGIETILSLRKTHPRVPVIVISGDSPRHAPLYLSVAQKLGARTTLLKPFSAEALLEAVKETLTQACIH